MIWYESLPPSYHVASISTNLSFLAERALGLPKSNC